MTYGPLDVVDGAARGLHAVSTGVAFRPSSKGGEDDRIFFETLDAPFMRAMISHARQYEPKVPQEVSDFIIDEYKVDGFRFDAVTSILY